MISRSKLPIGISDFKSLIEGGRYFVDKSLFIKEIIDAPAQVLLLPRPRRFGKTLNLTMLRYFFEKTEETNTHLFENLAIWQAGEEHTSMCGQYPVVYLTLKDVKTGKWEDCLEHLRILIAEEYRRHGYVMQKGGLDRIQQAEFRGIADRSASRADYENSLRQLLTYLEAYHHQKVILLIDEYDTPIHAGYVNGYYDDVIGFMRNWLSGALKDHPSLEKGVLTGILRVAKESIFSGLNNLRVYSLLARGPLADKFGFTQPEVMKLLEDFGQTEGLRQVEEWYNGYDFGGQTIYNPWSILCFLESSSPDCEPYWVNTSSNDLVYQLIQEGGEALKEDLEALMAGESLTRQIDDNIVLREVQQREDAIWPFLLFSGYLTASDPKRDGLDQTHDLSIPNLEVKWLYTHVIRSWLKKHLSSSKLQELCRSLISGQVPRFAALLQELVLGMMSYHDVASGGTRTPEAVYQAFVLGLLAQLGHLYTIRSNREAGTGRADIIMAPLDTSQQGVVLEFKSWEDGRSAEEQLEAALEQIEDRQYAAELAAQGVQQVLKLAVVFDGKTLHVKQK